MSNQLDKRLENQLFGLKKAGTYKSLKSITSAIGSTVSLGNGDHIGGFLIGSGDFCDRIRISCCPRRGGAVAFSDIQKSF